MAFDVSLAKSVVSPEVYHFAPKKKQWRRSIGLSPTNVCQKASAAHRQRRKSPLAKSVSDPKLLGVSWLAGFKVVMT